MNPYNISDLVLGKSTVPEDGPTHRTVIRLATSFWSDARGLHTKKSLTYQKRKCIGFNTLEEDSNIIDLEDLFMSITNLDDCLDGLYDVVIVNEERDWETGFIDGWEYKLIPYK